MPRISAPDLHRWDLAPEEAIALQKRLAGRLLNSPLPCEQLHTVAGVDVSVKAGVSRAAIVVMAFPSLDVLETRRATLPTPFPYVPGLLSFREGAVILVAYARLEQTPDVLIFDGQGQAHPRRLGIAAHIGLWLDRPTIGCGKSRLTGTHGDLGSAKGDFEPLLNPMGDVIGVVLRTRANVKPVYVSPGHRCDLDSARRVLMACVTRYRLPEPIRAAHHAAALSDKEARQEQPQHTDDNLA